MLKKLPLALFFSILLPGTTFALGFGEITVLSKLNEPLKVHIELVDSKSTPIDDITIQNAPRDIYRKANLPRPEALNRVKFKITQLANGSVIAVLTSKKPVREPFITFIADLRWRHGHINREYTFLLDPPEFIQKQSQPSSRQIAKVAPAKKIKTQPSYAPVTKKTSRRIQPTIDHSAVIAAHVSAKEYTTKKADTLWKIAKKLKPDNSVTTYQTMQALFVLNQEAFINGNINLLKQGKSLSIPNRDEIFQINGKKVLTSGVAKARKPEQAKIKKQVTSSRVIERASDTQKLSDDSSETKAPLVDEGRLKIIPPTQEILNRPVKSREDLKLINKALKTSIDTIKLLQNENDDLSAQIEELTARISSLDAQNEQLNNKITEITTYITEQDTSPASEEDHNEGSTPSITVQTEKTDTADTMIAVESELKPKTEKSRSFIRELLTNPVITLALAIFIVIILIGILIVARKTNVKRKQHRDNAYRPFSEVAQTKTQPIQKTAPAQSNVKTSQPPQSVNKLSSENKADKDEDDMDFFEYFEKKINAPEDDTSINNASPLVEPATPKEKSNSSSQETKQSADNSELNFSLDISDKDIEEYEKSINQSYQGQSSKDASENALSEVDTYLAYGNYDKAEEILLSEIQKSPSDKNLHLKLLESYSLSNKRYEFMKHVKSIVNLLNIDMVLRHRIETIYQQSWDETLNINKFT